MRAVRIYPSEGGAWSYTRERVKAIENCECCGGRRTPPASLGFIMFKREKVGLERYNPSLGMTEPFVMLRRFTEEVDRLFNELGFQRSVFPVIEPYGKTWIPAVEMFEKEKQLCIRVELPGLTIHDVKLELTENVLLLTGERKFERDEKKGEYFRTEREYGTFSREIALPEGVDATKVKATFTNGVLEVFMPLPATLEAKKRTIAIEEVAPKTAVKTAA